MLNFTPDQRVNYANIYTCTSSTPKVHPRLFGAEHLSAVFQTLAVPHCAVDDDVVADSSYLIRRLQTCQTADATHVHHQGAAAKA